MLESEGDYMRLLDQLSKVSYKHADQHSFVFFAMDGK